MQEQPIQFQVQFYISPFSSLRTTLILPYWVVNKKSSLAEELKTL